MDISKTIKAVLILDLDGNKVLGRTYDKQLESKKFEKKLFLSTKTHRIKNELLVLDQTLVCHKFVTDLHFYVIGNKHENPLILESVLSCLVEVATTLCPKELERQALVDQLTQTILAMDEICDDGVVLETDSNLVLQRVSLKDDVSEQTMAQRLQSATEQFKLTSWIRSYN